MDDPAAVDDGRLTYCGNVHPAEDLDGVRAAVARFTVPIAEAQRAAGRAFGVGAWWNAAVARTLADDPAARAALQEFFEQRGLEVWTLNVFPFGGFHDARVKEAVYRPDWASAERLRYTLDAARAVVEFAPAGSVVPLSTLPLGYGGADRTAAAHNLRLAARGLAELSEGSGRTLVLALEPEPFCDIETAVAAADFLEREVFASASAADQTALRRHLGVCVDLCHLAVVDEEPLAALAMLGARGIAVPKIQVSSCVEVREPAAAREELFAFDEPRYLHQTVAQSGARALDLPEVRARWAEFESAGRLRTHFHLPVFWDRDGPLGSTRAELSRVLPALEPPRPLLEVETYTWTVLDPSFLPERDLATGITRELQFVRNLISD